MADRPAATVRIGEEDHVPLLNRAVELLQKAVDEAAKLANDHLAIGIGDQRKGIALFPNAGAHRGADQRGVHLDTRVAQGVLDNIEGDRIDVLLGEGRRIFLNDCSRHDSSP